MTCPVEPMVPLSAAPSPQVIVQWYALAVAPCGNVTRAVKAVVLPVWARTSAPASALGGPPTTGGGPSLDLHVTAHTASVPTVATSATRSYRMSSFPGPSRLGLREPRGGRETGSGHPRTRRWW